MKHDKGWTTLSDFGASSRSTLSDNI